MKDIDVLLLSWAIVWFVAGFVAAVLAYGR
jgi:hypothetical protein